MTNENDHSDQQESSTYQPPTTYHRHFDPTKRATSTVVLSAVAECKSTTPLDLPTLGNKVDTDALNTLVSATRSGRNQASDLLVRFTYAGCVVRVHSDGKLTVSLEDDTEDESSWE